MLNNCDAGDKAVITSHTSGYQIRKKMYFYNSTVHTSGMHNWDLETNLPVFKSRKID